MATYGGMGTLPVGGTYGGGGGTVTGNPMGQFKPIQPTPEELAAEKQRRAAATPAKPLLSNTQSASNQPDTAPSVTQPYTNTGAPPVPQATNQVPVNPATGQPVTQPVPPPVDPNKIQDNTAPIPANMEGYAPAQIQTDPTTDTVEGRIEGIVNKNSPLMQQAATRARQRMNTTGLLNSSMAVGAGQSAVYDAALPIASQDAQQANLTKQANVQAQNESMLVSKQGEINRQLITAEGDVKQQLLQQQGVIDNQLQELRGEQAKELSKQQAAETSQLQQEMGGINLKLIGAEGAVKAQLLQQQGAIDTRLQYIRGDQALQQTQVQAQAESKLMAQKAAIDKQLQSADAQSRERLLQQQGQIDKDLRAIAGSQEMEMLLTQGKLQADLQAERLKIDQQMQSADASTRLRLQGRQGEIDKEMLKAQGDQTLAQIAAQGKITTALEQERNQLSKDLLKAEGRQRLDLLNRQGQLDKEIEKSRAGYQMDLYDRQGEIESQLQRARINGQWDLEQSLLKQKGTLEKELTGMNAQLQKDMQKFGLDGQKALTKMQGDYNTLINTSNSAAQLWSQHTAAVATIMADPNMPVSQKQQMIDQLTKGTQTGMSLIGSMGNVDLAGLVDWGVSNAPGAGRISGGGYTSGYSNDTTGGWHMPNRTPSNPSGMPKTTAEKQALFQRYQKATSELNYALRKSGQPQQTPMTYNQWFTYYSNPNN